MAGEKMNPDRRSPPGPIRVLAAWMACTGLFLTAKGTLGSAVDADQVFQAAERTLAERPQEALALARQAAPQLQGRPDLLKRLWTQAARLQEQSLLTLTEAQVQELAGVCTVQLEDPQAAERIRRTWLKDRLAKAPADDGPARLHLARLWRLWLDERDEAVRLTQDALRLAPATVQQLRFADLELLGAPKRTTRQVLYRRYLEQRFYDVPFPLLIELEYTKGLDPHLQTVRVLAGPKS
jgi:hypothetical protein